VRSSISEIALLFEMNFRLAMDAAIDCWWWWWLLYPVNAPLGKLLCFSELASGGLVVFDGDHLL